MNRDHCWEFKRVLNTILEPELYMYIFICICIYTHQWVSMGKKINIVYIDAF